MEKIAHKNKNDVQLLSEHLLNVSLLGKDLAKSVYLSDTLYILGLFHDIGKADKLFQDYINSQEKRRIIHSSAGGKYLNEKINSVLIDNEFRELYSNILEYVIYAHHGVFDIISIDEENNLYLKLYYNELNKKYDYEDVKKWTDLFLEENNIDIDKVIKSSYKEIENILTKLESLYNKEEKIRIKSVEKNWYNHALVRLLLSLLKEADVEDTVSFEYKIKMKNNEVLWEEEVEKIEKISREFEEKEITAIHKVRNKLSQQIKGKADLCTTGIYKLSAPTGSGKTILSLRFALNNAKKFKKEKIYYISSFLSVLEQNVDEYKKILGKDCVLEYHSNLEKNDIDDSEESTIENMNIKNQYLEETWSSKFIATTTVQFFNSLFKGKSINIRRFNKFKNSIIILDEIQNLPDKILYNFILMVKFMENVLNTTFIFCTATQPVFDSEYLKFNLKYGNNNIVDLIEIEEDDRDVFKRSDFSILGNDDHITIEELVNEIELKIKKKSSILLVMNTKSRVRILYKQLFSNVSLRENVKIYHLSTSMCPQHRLNKIKEIKQKLLNNEKIIVISTQLIEAGVDLDFEVVYRSLAGIDSIIQSAGRCNREGKKSKGEVYLFAIDENLKYLQEIKDKGKAAQDVFRKNNKGLELEKLFKCYYNTYYKKKIDSKVFDYELKNDDTLLDKLSKNQNKLSILLNTNKKENFRGLKIFQDFKTAANLFELIDKQGNSELQGIIVRYKNDNLIDELKQSYNNNDFEKYKKIKKKLQRYTINLIYEYDCEDLLDRVGDVYILRDEYYDEELGFFKENVNKETEILIF